jgi:formylmethanofuran dehydrogenase subunit A
MRGIWIFLIAVIFILGLGAKKVKGQSMAIGHANAEVVESVSVASANIKDFDISKSLMQTINEGIDSETHNLDAITVNSGSYITCNIVLTSASLEAINGNAFAINPALKRAQYTTVAKSAGLQTIKIGAIAKLKDKQYAGLYAGTYTVVFAYN